MREASVSVMSNIAEGAGRDSSAQFSHFLNISQGSLSELDSQYFVSKELGFITNLTEIRNIILPLRQGISNLKKTLK